MKKITFLLIAVLLFTGCNQVDEVSISNTPTQTATPAIGATIAPAVDDTTTPTLAPTPTATVIPTATPTPAIRPTAKPTAKTCEHSYYLPKNPWQYVGLGWPGYVDVPNGIMLATCTEDGYTVHVCSKCGDVYTDNYIKAYGHDFSEDEEVFVYPGFEREGFYIKNCTRCSEQIKTRTIPKHGGSFDTIKAPVEAISGVKCDSYLYEDESMFILDRRTWGDVPTVWVDFENSCLVLESTLKDGTPYVERITFPEVAYPGQECKYKSEILESGKLNGVYYVTNWDGQGS